MMGAPVVIGDRARIVPFCVEGRNVEGKVVQIDVHRNSCTVELETGVWTGPLQWVSVVIPPDLRHPAVIEARRTDPERWHPFDSADEIAARHVATTLRWVLDNIDFEKPARWLGEQADLVDASVTKCAPSWVGQP